MGPISPRRSQRHRADRPHLSPDPSEGPRSSRHGTNPSGAQPRFGGTSFPTFCRAPSFAAAVRTTPTRPRRRLPGARCRVPGPERPKATV